MAMSKAWARALRWNKARAAKLPKTPPKAKKSPPEDLSEPYRRAPLDPPEGNWVRP